MKTFVGIGSNHKDDVFDRVQTILREHNIGCVTLELKISIEDSPKNWWESWRQRKRVQEILGGSLEYKVLFEGRGLRIEINGFSVYSSQRCSPEFKAGIDYALKKDLPFYFIYWSDQFPDTIFKFKNRMFRPISLCGKTTYQNYPNEFSEHEGKIIIEGDDLDARNRFSADAINYLFESFDTTAYIGGNGHFDSSPGPILTLYRCYNLSEGLELQHLVNANTKIVYDLPNNTKREF